VKLLRSKLERVSKARSPEAERNLSQKREEGEKGGKKIPEKEKKRQPFRPEGKESPRSLKVNVSRQNRLQTMTQRAVRFGRKRRDAVNESEVRVPKVPMLRKKKRKVLR